ncbi:MAG: NADH-quinone oxidoreductase subunit C [Gammaproteobacteria bacterium]|nr:NADH-quinone oxidoreductase subunit C [Gammaproteobacteria bacterium]MCY4166579.1 NADH-quinone oxidoreductase subunit C [Gammaproteobacteria bacterium]MCY4256632.1 NADH-quinone oxidoreductase subunit C [Gammaproteobacteria bacterium]MCY4341453.1 NADH-quinone oxidoreductase subunit C [Gammaproteobacteria bacterium]
MSVAKLDSMAHALGERFGGVLRRRESSCGELSFDLDAPDLVNTAALLRGEEEFSFESLIDVCGVDYLGYGQVQWRTEQATGTGFSRAVQPGDAGSGPSAAEGEAPARPRFAAIYHLLSLRHNLRIRLRVFAQGENPPLLPSVTGIWQAADWFEREAFDLFGLVFEDHGDLRRILTDYGFIGHPFRKDFPLSGKVEVRYDESKRRVVYEPVSIEPRTLVPRVIRDDHRYRPELRAEPSVAEEGGEASADG